MSYTNIEDARDDYSDIYKDANGFRPRFDRSEWTLEDYNKEYRFLQDCIEWDIDRAAQEEYRKELEHNELVNICIAAGACDMETAKRWASEAQC